MRKFIIATVAICMAAEVSAVDWPPFTCTTHGRFPNPEGSIDSYYLCIVIMPSSPLQLSYMTCPNALVFNPVTQSCTTTDNVDLCALYPSFNSAACDTGGVWVTVAPGVERKATGKKVCCNNSGCNAYSPIEDFKCNGTVEYRCAAGYYGVPLTRGCNSCVTDTGNPNATSKAGSSGIIDCHIPKGTTGSNSSGTFVISDDCYYNNK